MLKGRGCQEFRDGRILVPPAAADAGLAEAQYNLGVCYADGDGVAKDAGQAVLWYRRAAEAGVADAQFNIGVCFANGDGAVKDEEQAVSWFRRAAEAGDADAQHILGWVDGVPSTP